MGYKCRICGINEVENVGDICELCAISQDPYSAAMSNGKNGNSTDVHIPASGGATYSSHKKNREILINRNNALANKDPYGNDISTPADYNSNSRGVPIRTKGSESILVSGSSDDLASPNDSANSGDLKKGPISTGITKNISVDVQERSAVAKIFRSLFFGIPYSSDDDITTFQVFPDHTGSSLNAMGNACDQVIVYGKITTGAISENNSVDVYGYRDANNNVIAKKIVNTASGTTITPIKSISAGVIRGLFSTAAGFLILIIIICLFM